MICTPCCGCPRDVRRSRRRPYSTAAPYAPCRRAAVGGLLRAQACPGSKLHMAVDTLGHLLALHVTPANADDRSAVVPLAQTVQDAASQGVELAHVDQGCTGERPTQAAAHGIALEVVRLSEAERGFVLLPRRWMVEGSFGWIAHFRHLARDYERLPETIAARCPKHRPCVDSTLDAIVEALRFTRREGFWGGGGTGYRLIYGPMLLQCGLLNTST